jgi:hypothetical protein
MGTPFGRADGGNFAGSMPALRDPVRPDMDLLARAESTNWMSMKLLNAEREGRLSAGGVFGPDHNVVGGMPPKPDSPHIQGVYKDPGGSSAPVPKLFLGKVGGKDATTSPGMSMPGNFEPGTGKREPDNSFSVPGRDGKERPELKRDVNLGANNIVGKPAEQGVAVQSPYRHQGDAYTNYSSSSRARELDFSSGGRSKTGRDVISTFDQRMREMEENMFDVHEGRDRGTPSSSRAEMVGLKSELITSSPSTRSEMVGLKSELITSSPSTRSEMVGLKSEVVSRAALAGTKTADRQASYVSLSPSTRVVGDENENGGMHAPRGVGAEEEKDPRQALLEAAQDDDDDDDDDDDSDLESSEYDSDDKSAQASPAGTHSQSPSHVPSQRAETVRAMVPKLALNLPAQPPAGANSKPAGQTGEVRKKELSESESESTGSSSVSESDSESESDQDHHATKNDREQHAAVARSRDVDATASSPRARATSVGDGDVRVRTRSALISQKMIEDLRFCVCAGGWFAPRAGESVQSVGKALRAWKIAMVGINHCHVRV